MQRKDKVSFSTRPFRCARACFARWPNRALSVWERPLTYRTSKLLQLPSQTRLTCLLETSGRKPRLIPSLASPKSTFRSSISPGSSIAVSLGKRTLLEVMAKNLGVAPEEFSSIFQDQPQAVKINDYPPCPRADEVLGLSPHTDGTGLTLLLQVNDVEGLHIRNGRAGEGGGDWFPVKPLPGAVIANIGDIIEIINSTQTSHNQHISIVCDTDSIQ
ncbi:unnamed protein product [Musa acuminata subsp. malaccensis]|uniref:(wild Malaysian banana) hypothetical protein n=1 Tax=Musa acuminata subsp. malaccensis TaxID=214687 RepID=A0A804L442_MUSAM|nr:unnamed protein product [Musa acuminata subsp. malaccensis]